VTGFEKTVKEGSLVSVAPISAADHDRFNVPREETCEKAREVLGLT
jgi:hypothetical protein